MTPLLKTRQLSKNNWHEDSFFGLHYDLHANAEDTELGKDVTFEHIYHELNKVKPDFVQYDCKGHPGYTSYPTKVGTSTPGIVKDALKTWREVTRKMGIPLSVHYSGVLDEIAVARHPEWARIEIDGSRSKNATCNNSSYIEKLMIPQMLEVIDMYDIDGFWVDGENWGSAPCWCETCQRRFRVETDIKNIPHSKKEAHWQEWLEFHRKSFERHVRQYTEAVHRRKPTCLISSNWMYSVRQPEKMSVPVDYLSGDFMPSFGCERASLESRFLSSRGITWNLMAWGSFRVGQFEGWTYPAGTFKTAEHLCQEAAEVIANSGNIFIYDVPQRSGHLIGWHHDILAKVAKFCRARQEYCQNTKAVPQVVILHNTADYYHKNDPLYNLGNAIDSIEGCLHALLENHYSVEILNEFDLMARLKDYPVVVFPEVEKPNTKLLRSVQEYVSNGGNLLITGPLSASLFGDLLGVELEGSLKVRRISLPAGNEMVKLKFLWQSVKVTTAQELYPLYKGEEPLKDKLNEPAATINNYGKGKVIGIYGPVFESFVETHYPRLRFFLGNIMAQFQNPQLLQVAAPPKVEVILRRKGNKILLHLLNRGTGHPLSPRNHAVEDIPPVGPIKITLPLARKPEGVYLAPEKSNPIWNWQNGLLDVEISSLQLYNILVVE